MSVFKHFGPLGWCVAIAAAFLAVLAACDTGPNFQYEAYGNVRIVIELDGEIHELENGFRIGVVRAQSNIGGLTSVTWEPPLYKVLDDGRVILAVTDHGIPVMETFEADYHVYCRNESCDDPRIPPRSIGIAVLDDAADPQTLRPYILRGFGDEAEAYGGDIRLLEVEVAVVKEDTRKWPAAEVPWLAGPEELVRRGERTNGAPIAYANEEERRRLRDQLERPNSSSRFEGQTFCLNVLHLAGPRGWRPYVKQDVPKLFQFARQHDELHVANTFEWDPIEPVFPTRTGISWIDEELNAGDAFMMVAIADDGSIAPLELVFTSAACAFEWPKMETVNLGTYRLTPNNEELPGFALADDASLFAQFRGYDFAPEAFFGFSRSIQHPENRRLLQQAIQETPYDFE